MSMCQEVNLQILKSKLANVMHRRKHSLLCLLFRLKGGYLCLNIEIAGKHELNQ